VGERRVVLLFPTTHAVMRASQLLEDVEVEHEIIPRPKGVNADCGIAISLRPESRGEATQALAEGDSEPSRVLELERPDRRAANRRSTADD